jgi:hypothetical protein
MSTNPSLTLYKVHFFYSDFKHGSTLADDFDDKLATDSSAVGGSEYSSLTSLAVRQAFGALEYTNTPAEPLVFMKEISSDGNVNTVDVIYPFHPIAVYANSDILKWLLDPLFINQEAGMLALHNIRVNHADATKGNWPKKYSVHDIGSAFPNATGHINGNAEDQPLEECNHLQLCTELKFTD